MKRAIFLALAGVMLAAGPASATPEDVANDISQHIMSPFCPGVTLHDCPSDSAVALRDRIKTMAEGGATRAQIMRYLIDEYGETIRAEPAGGSGLAAWLLPGVAAIAGGAMTWRLLRRWAYEPAAPADDDSDDPIGPSDRRRIDAELDNLRTTA